MVEYKQLFRVVGVVDTVSPPFVEELVGGANLVIGEFKGLHKKKVGHPRRGAPSEQLGCELVHLTCEHIALVVEVGKFVVETIGLV